MKKIISLIVFISLFLTVNGQTADEVLAGYYENIGGVEAWKNLHSMKMTGTSSMQGMEFPITIYMKRPNLEKVEVEVQGMQIIQAFDGATAWSVNPFQGSPDPSKADQETSDDAANKRFEDELIDYAEKGHSVELLGSEEIEGTETHKLKLTKSSGDEVIYFLDTEHNIPLMVRSFVGAGPMKGQAVETYFSDYEMVSEIMIPMSITQKMNGTAFMSGTMDNVELNVDLSDDMFEFPVNDDPAKANENVEKIAQKETVKEVKKESKEEIKEEVKEMKSVKKKKVKKGKKQKTLE
ncbi:MAG: hypothetical protein OEQ53_00775 [Saprospiraceae bacterium]|nr:hypothetical protein [Saprospiraceae bacterium]